MTNKNELSNEEMELLLAAEKGGGEIYVIRDIDQLPTTVTVKGKESKDFKYATLQSLLRKGLVKLASADYYILTTRGLKKAKELSKS